MHDQFNLFEWLKIYFNKNEMFEHNEIKAISDFSILWNLFENKLCGNNANANCFSRISNIYSTRQPLIAIINSSIEYFKERYVDVNSNFKPLFNGLLFRSNDNQELVKDVLLDCRNSTSSKIEALLIIIYRFRCNLFHGSKDIETIHLQNVNFEIINQFLVKLLEENNKRNITNKST